MRLQAISLKMPQSLLARADRFAMSRHVSRSELIRVAMQYALANRDVLRLFEKLAPREHGYRMVTVKMEVGLLNAYTWLSQTYGISRSELIRRALESFLDENHVQDHVQDQVLKARVEIIKL
ncbi:hypothetical protein D878_gp05 [Sulfolobales Mexican rudivirus 1]|uniref:Ribbon-helix-helix protein CopG domain-containing protein n=1 Tax=Sulfolobales Mexican rod-shaped virus 1 TaxID=2848122 RepID=K4PAI4_9VIRU|nr:hypothetical protein D878_gp05 [Sulfolobales Mexican rudivirus 1]AFV51232.1 hypothetical protein [Sulfolobales Mexican rod-shaped virus 1]